MKELLLKLTVIFFAVLLIKAYLVMLVMNEVSKFIEWIPQVNYGQSFLILLLITLLKPTEF